MFNKVWAFLSKLPVAKFLKPVWKYALKQAVEIGGNELQAEFISIFKKKSPGWMGQLKNQMDHIPKRFQYLLDSVPLPQTAEDKAFIVVRDAVERLKNQLATGVDLGEAAINAAFDRFQEDVKARIDRL
jgi:hypothetical protein